MKKQVLTLIFCTSMQLLCAQITNPLDEKYKPAENSVFSSNNRGNSSSNSGVVIDRKVNQITFLFTDITRSDVKFEYERKLSASFSAIAGFGMSYGKDYIERYMNAYEISNQMNDDGIYNNRSLDHLYPDSRKNSGYSFSLGLKKYFSEEDAHSSYLGLQWKMSNNKYSIINNGSYIYYDYNPINLDYSVRLNYFTFIMGTSFRTEIGKMHFISDISYGFGFKLTYYDRFTLQDKPIELQTESVKTWYVKKEERLNYLNPYLLFRYQLGIAW